MGQKRQTVSMGELLTPDDVIRVLKISKQGFYGMVNRGQIPGAIKVGKMWRFMPETFYAGLKKKMTKKRTAA